MATNANEILDRLAALLDAATPGHWTREKPAVDADGWSMGTAVAGTPGRQTIYTNHLGGTFPSADCNMIAAIRNAAPALIRLARAALWLDNVPRHTGDHDLEIEIAKKEDDLGDALDALGEVRL